MKRSLNVSVVLICLCVASSGLVLGIENDGSVSGSWGCVAHSTGQGDMPYTLNLNQARDKITGTYTGPIPGGRTEVKDVRNGSVREKRVEMHFDDNGADLFVLGRIAKDGRLSGEWGDNGKQVGAWECKRTA